MPYKHDIRHTLIGSKHRALSRYYMILNRLKNTNKAKNKNYEGISMDISKEEFVKWFMRNDYERCSVDRIDKNKNYTMDNIQMVPLAENIRKDKVKAKDGYCECYSCHLTKPLDEFVVDRRRANGHGTCCKDCDRKRKCKRRNT